MNITPYITEKSLKLAGSKQYTFTVKGKFNKVSIATFITEHFHVHPVSVNTVTKNWNRFAIVRVQPNEKIEGFEAETNKKSK
ncbi:50S ribosomal protein L23 [Candidatus Berkelbacteria bacterium]|nr:50S ribosomal protein L23 [Candidatus Berkelbacteria bacterium]